MIIRVEYDKTDATLTLTKDDDIVAVINDDTVVDNSNSLSFEIALDVSQYQEQYNEAIVDGNNNE
jgi:competence transcription factor ComK